MAGLPARIQVGAFIYRVVADQARLRTEERAGRDHYYGLFCAREQELLIDPTLPPAQLRDTLWHEVKHCVNHLAAFGGRDRLTEEDVVARTCSLELMVLRANPQLVRFLVEADDAVDQEGQQDHARDGGGVWQEEGGRRVLRVSQSGDHQGC